MTNSLAPSSWVFPPRTVLAKSLKLIFKRFHDSVSLSLTTLFMVVLHFIEQFAVLPIFRIPAGLLPIYNTCDLSRIGNHKISDSEITMCEIDLTRIRKKISIDIPDESFLARSLAG